MFLEAVQHLCHVKTHEAKELPHKEKLFHAVVRRVRVCSSSVSAGHTYNDNNHHHQSNTPSLLVIPNTNERQSAGVEDMLSLWKIWFLLLSFIQSFISSVTNLCVLEEDLLPP